MMRLLFLTISTLHTLVIAQTFDTLYYRYSQNINDYSYWQKDSTAYYRLLNKRNTDTIQFVRDYYSSGSLRHEGYYKNPKDLARPFTGGVGRRVFYFENGTVNSIDTVLDGRIHGLEHVFYPSGKIHKVNSYKSGKLEDSCTWYFQSGKISRIIHYKDNKLQGWLTIYYESGTIRRRDLYSANRLLDGYTFDSLGQPVAYLPYNSEPKFEGDLGEYFGDNLVYPKEALKNGYEDLIFSSFIVEKDGSISNIKIIKGKYEILNNEAKRIISSMPKWIPAQKDGEPERTMMKMPIRFSIPKRSNSH